MSSIIPRKMFDLRQVLKFVKYILIILRKMFDLGRALNFVNNVINYMEEKDYVQTKQGA